MRAMVNKWTRAPAPVPALHGSAFTGEDGLNPDFAKWAKFTEWTACEAAALLCGLDPDYASRTWSRYSSPTRYLPRDKKAQYDGLRQLAERTPPSDFRYGLGAAPASWLAWAKKYDIHMPPELEAEIVKWSGVGGSVGSAASAQEQEGVVHRNASVDQIRCTLREIYAEAKLARNKPPNVNEATTKCARRLKENSYQASENFVKPIAGEPEFSNQRLKPGQHFK